MGTCNIVKIDTVAIVLARGGSERLPRKNLLPLCGKPLINWTFEAVIKSKGIGLIVVSSDDEEILSEAKKFGIRTIKRPEELATNVATSFDAIAHVIDMLRKEGIEALRVMLLQPTSPLRTTEDINNAIVKMDETDANSIISVCEVEHSPLWSNTLNEDCRMDNFIDSSIKDKRSQDLATYYRLNGAIYLAKVDKLFENKGFIMKDSRATIMPKERSIDIDCLLDFNMAEHLMKKKIEQEINE